MHSDLQAFLSKLQEFNIERNWTQFHSPKNLVLDLASEVGELAEHFRWLKEEESFIKSADDLEEIADELGDIFRIVVYLSSILGIDPVKAASRKLEKMAIKYPAEKVKGSSLKYTKYPKEFP